MTIAKRSQNDRKSDGLGIIVRTIANHRRYSVSVSVRDIRTLLASKSKSSSYVTGETRDVLELRASHAN